MTFVESISTCLKKYVTFKGRASRSEFWWFYLFNFLCGIVAGLLDKAIGISVISTVVSLGLFLPGLAVAVRRCHDSDHSGWWVICPIFNIILMFFGSSEGANRFDEAAA